MNSTVALINQATGMEKLAILASEIDAIKRQLQEGSSQSPHDLDSLIETIEVADLAERCRVSLETLRAKIRSVLGDGAVFRLGKAWVIRKTTYLDGTWRAFERDSQHKSLNSSILHGYRKYKM